MISRKYINPGMERVAYINFISEKGFQKIPTEEKDINNGINCRLGKRTLCENTDQRAGLRGKMKKTIRK